MTTNEPSDRAQTTIVKEGVKNEKPVSLEDIDQIPDSLSPTEQLQALREVEARLTDERTEIISRLVDRYTALLRLLQQGDPAKQELIQKLGPMRRRLVELQKIAATEREIVPVDALADFRNDEFFSDSEKEEIIALYDRLPPPLQQKMAARLRDTLTKPTEASRITSLHSVRFEASRYVRILEQGLEQPSGETIPSVNVTFTGYGRDEMDFSDTHRVVQKKDSPIDFDVPIKHGDRPFVYECKSYSRKQCGFDAGVRNQALKYQAAIDQGLIAGATMEVRGRISPEFIAWAMGTAIDDTGAIPDVQIVYATELPSGKEFRFILKRSNTGEGLSFRNEDRYDDSDLELIRGFQHSVVDKSIRGILSDTHIDEAASDKAYTDFFDYEINDTATLRKAVAELMGMDFADSEQMKKVMADFLDNIGDHATLLRIGQAINCLPAKAEAMPATTLAEKIRKELKKKIITEEQAFQILNAALARGTEESYNMTDNPAEAVRRLWDYCLCEPGRIGSRKFYESYWQARNDTLFAKLRALAEKAKVNTDNKVSSVSERAADDRYTTDLILHLQDFYRLNPDIARMKRQYVLKPEQVPEAVRQTMVAVGKIREYELQRAGDSAEAERRVRRRELGWTGREEGVALDVEHVAMDTIYSMNSGSFDQTEVKAAVGDENVALFFDPLPSGQEGFILKYRTKAELDIAMSGDPALKKAYESLPRKKIETLEAIFKRAEFVRSYEWPERFITVEQIDAYLEGQDRRYQEIHVFDGRTGSTERHADTNDEKIAQTEYNIIRENVSRAKDYIKGTARENQNKREIHTVEAEIVRLTQEKDQRIAVAQAEAQQLVGQLGRENGELQGKRKTLNKEKQSAKGDRLTSIEDEIQQIDRRIEELKVKRTRAFDEVREISAEYTPLIKTQYGKLEGIYRHIIPAAEWRTFAQEITYRKDENLIKFIYAVTAEGEVIVQEEIFRGDVTGRAAHSELGRGRNTYGAGELAFRRDGDRWYLAEINNGSGHYRPDATNTLPYVQRVIAAKGVDVSRVQLVDCILRGRPLKDVGAL